MWIRHLVQFRDHARKAVVTAGSVGFDVVGGPTTDVIGYGRCEESSLNDWLCKVVKIGNGGVNVMNWSEWQHRELIV